MKNHLLFSVLLSMLGLKSYAQQALTFEQARNGGIRTTYLDSIYQSGAHADSTQAVFQFNRDEFISSYQKMLQELGAFLARNNFVWEKTTRGFNRIYFNSSGKIDYFLYSFRADQLTADQEARFGELLSEFIKIYTFPMSASKDFAQCSPVTYTPGAK